MTDAETAPEPVYPKYWLTEAIRSLAEGDSGLALRFARCAVNELEFKVKDEIKGL